MNNRSHNYFRSFTDLDRLPELSAELAKSYRPIMTLMMTGALCFYGFITAFRLAHGQGQEQLLVNIMSGATCFLFAWVLVYLWNAKSVSFARLEAINAFAFAAIFANVCLELLQFSDAFRLIYLCIYILGIAVGGISLRVVVPGILAATGFGFWILVDVSPQVFLEYTITFVASVAAGFTVAAMLRALVHREVSARLEAETLGSIARKEADRDGLTGLSNRRAFIRFLNGWEREADLTLFSIDVDGFKAINDFYGHPAGDAALAEVARRLKLVFSGTDAMIARLGGDEFAVAVETQEQDLQGMLDKIFEEVRQPINLSGRASRLSASVGVARYPEFGDTALGAFECADFALIDAKKSGKDCAVLFSEVTQKCMSRSVDIEHALQNADFEAEMALVFQPQFDVMRNQVVGFEALARWHSPLLGNVSPHEFIPSAERLGLIRKLTPVLLSKALHEASRWPEQFKLSFNLSSADFVSTEGVTAVIRTVQSSGFDPSRLTLEMTETAIVEDFHRAILSAYRFSELGIRISMDDFGAGQSSLGRLDELPLDEIKLDRHFLSQVTHSFKTQKIVETLIKLCGTLGMNCVIEGVETAHQMDVLKDLGGSLFQGYYTGRPMPANEVSDWILRASDARVVADRAVG